MQVKLHTITPDIEATIVEIARVSSFREDKRAKPAGLLKYLIKNQHWSPFEHGFLTMKIGTSRAICVQFLRHRSFTFQQFSLRYAVASTIERIELRKQANKNRQSSEEELGALYDLDGTIFLEEGPVTEKQHHALLHTRIALQDIIIAYKKLIDSGVAKETARFILPLATQTTFYMTGPVRSWIHMIELRDDEHAQKEAQDIAREMKRIFCKNLPIISGALGWV